MALREHVATRPEHRERPRISAAPPATACRHCGLPVPEGARHAGFCCAGCAAVHELLHGIGLQRFYELGGGRCAPVGAVPRPAARAWLPELEERGRLAGDQVRLALDVQGIHCAACVWLLEQLWRRRKGALRIEINPSLGRAVLVYDRARLQLGDWIDEVERLGYRLAPPGKVPEREDRGLLVRLGICVALALNAMMFALAGYLGLDREGGSLADLFAALSLGLSTAAVAAGGPVFFRGALGGLRRRVLHLDLPIALGIALAYGGSLAGFLTGTGASYFDTVTVFIALMVAGRYVQRSALRRNRSYLLRNDGAEHMRVRRLRGEELERVPVTAVAAGDRLRLAPGDLLPVNARLDGAAAAFSLDWINGESEPRAFPPGAAVPAGAFAAGRRGVDVIALASAADSGLLALLATPAEDRDLLRARGAFWAWLNRAWVGLVLALAAAAGALWLVLDPGRALDVTTAVLVVTCPCALGLATPLAVQMAIAALRRRGVFVRSQALLERARSVAKVIFDKTGTVTWGTLEAHALRRVDPAQHGDEDVLRTMAASSNHPVSRAIGETLRAQGGRFLPDLAVDEVPGEGLEAARGGDVYRLGRPSFVFGERRPDVPEDVCVFARNGRVEACFLVEEDLRRGFAREVADLREGGIDVWLLSGDRPEKVARVAERLGIATDRAHGALSPQDKAAIVAGLDDADTLMVGDGLNDAPAFAAAWCAGTPALDAPVMPARADFFFTGAGAGAVTAVLAASRRFHRVVRANLALAGVYNAVAVPLCFAGLMTPLLCAVLMPLSSLLLIGHTVLRLRAAPAERVPWT